MIVRRGARWREEEGPEKPAEGTLNYAGALRAARALIGLTQGEVAGYIGMSRRSLETCEEGSDATLKAIAALREFYNRAGFEFLGAVDLTTGAVLGSGVCWKPRALVSRAARLPIPSVDAHFSAARALLGLEQKEVATKANLSARQVRNLESGRFTGKAYNDLRRFFDGKKVEFLSSTVSGVEYPAAGVRFASERVLLPPRLRAIHKVG